MPVLLHGQHSSIVGSLQMAFAKMIPIPLAEVIHDSHVLRSGMMGI